MLLGLAWHNTVLEQRQVVIKTAVIPSMNSSWARTQREKAEDGQIERERQRERDRQGNRGRER